MDLVIVESPTKARTLSRFLSSNYKIEATMGHVRDLPRKKFGIEIKGKDKKNKEYEFIPQYQIISERRKKVVEIKKLSKEAVSVILATDPDREGEAIAYHIKQLMSQKSKTKGRPSIHKTKFKRIVFHEITKTAVEHALAHPKNIDAKLVDAQQARRILDRIVGYRLSPLLWNKLGKRWLSAGRVQTVAVRLIVDRERQIKAFKPVEYWIVDVRLEKQSGGVESQFTARLIKIEGKKADIKAKKTALKIVDELQKAVYKVADIKKEERFRRPGSPFITSTLQQRAAGRYGWSAKRTIRTAQKLYEEGYITYHRTDSTTIAKEALFKVRKFIGGTFSNKYLPSSFRIYKTKSKVAQEAHEAIRPTDVWRLSARDFSAFQKEGYKSEKLKTISEKLGRDAEYLYSLIWKKFVASQMKEAVFDSTTVDIKAKKDETYLFRSHGQKLKFDGWLKLYKNINLSEKTAENDITDQNLPQLQVDEKLNLKEVLPQQKFTEPPKRYNEASLIKALEEKGIGRPSTYAPIISTIQDRRYVEKIERKFHPTDLGMVVVDFLVKYFPDVFNIAFTARMEDDLDEIANGKHVWTSVLGEFYSPFKIRLDEVYKQADRVKVDLGQTSERCKKCGAAMAVRLSKYGKFLACSTYPECDFTKSIIQKAGIKCPKCGADIVIKNTRRGKRFYGCSSFPKCKFAAWKKEEITKQQTANNK